MSNSKGHPEIVQFLLDKKCDIEAKDQNFHTPRHMAAHFGFLEVVKILVEHGANVDAKNREKKTPLFMATERGFLFVVQFLIERGANLYEKNVSYEQGKKAASFGRRDRGHSTGSCLVGPTEVKARKYVVFSQKVPLYFEIKNTWLIFCCTLFYQSPPK